MDDPEEMKNKLDELTKQFEEMKADKERLQIEKEAAENLLRGTDRANQQPAQSYMGPDRTVDPGRLVREASGVNIPPAQQQFDQDLDKHLQEYLKKFSAEQLSDPETLRSILYEYGKNVGSFSYQNATRTALDIFQKSVEIKNNIDAVIGDWRKRHPDLANKEDEDFIEYVLLNKIATNPANRGKHLSVLLDLATEEAVRLKSAGQPVQRKSEPTTTPTTLRSSRIGVAAGPKVEEQTEEPQNEVDRFFAMRQKMNKARQWTGRPSS